MKEFDKVNVIYGLIATAGAAIFGQYWFLFAGFLLMNIVDYATGLVKAKRLKKESSAVGAWGVFKKVSYWIVIGLAFFIAHSFVYMGEIIGVNLSFVVLFGWFTLASYLINEIRSILENLVELGVKVPTFLISGLDITKKLLDAKVEIKNEQEETDDEN